MTPPAPSGQRAGDDHLEEPLRDPYYLMVLLWLYRDSVAGGEVGFAPERAAFAAASGGVVAEGMIS